MQQENNPSAKVLKIVSGVFLLTLLGKLLGFVRELLLSYYYGASGLVDAYLISQTIPGTIFQFVGVGLATCFIPIYYRVKRERDDQVANLFVNRILTATLGFTSIVIIIVLLFTPYVVKLFASGFEGQTLEYAIWFTRIVIVGLFCSSFIYVFSSYLQANNRFNVVSFASVINGIIIIASIILSSCIGFWVLIAGSILSLGIQALFLWFPTKSMGLKIHFDFKMNDEYGICFLKIMIPVVLGVSVTEINTLIDRSLASNLAVGGISALSYANSLVMFAQGGIIQPITTIFYPKIAQLIAVNEHYEANKQVANLLSSISNVLLPVSLCFLFFSEPITKVVFGRGAFDQSAVSMTSGAIQCYSIGILFYGIREIMSRYFYAHSNTNVPMVASAIGVGCNIILNLVFSYIWGLSGLAIATSVSTIVTACLMWCIGKRKIPDMSLKIKDLQLFRSFFAGVLSVVPARAMFSALPFSQMINFFLSVSSFLLLWILFGLVMRLNFWRFLVNSKNKKRFS